NPLYANSATYTILERGVVETPIDARGRAGEYQALKGHLVTLRGVLNRQDLRESEHFVAHFVADGHVVHVYHWTPAPRAVEAQEGDIFEITGLYNPMHESRTETIEIDLWVRDISDIKVVGNLAMEPRFEIPLTTIDEMPDQFNGDVPEVHIAGIVESHQPGKGFVVRDTTGQVMVRTLQTIPLQIGDIAEAVGQPFTGGADWMLRNSLIRRASPE